MTRSGFEEVHVEKRADRDRRAQSPALRLFRGGFCPCQVLVPLVQRGRRPQDLAILPKGGDTGGITPAASPFLDDECRARRVLERPAPEGRLAAEVLPMNPASGIRAVRHPCSPWQAARGRVPRVEDPLTKGFDRHRPCGSFRIDISPALSAMVFVPGPRVSDAAPATRENNCGRGFLPGDESKNPLLLGPLRCAVRRTGLHGNGRDGPA